ncbi:hypothetical protein Pst134EA_005581 [Puccinia striiformis f. sp. tritici]|uniref:hypothetical protein n=1 Tax=Puccinia striiformis f. sp. tritici TaxID=168172 RepID=UPI002007B83C|nr:hypothetical protein Pst134EA_005581 [Puccinia striiformis f. sp. tritici]KAH9471702.1 hypothetical protein Pst134EA_005581 [Puccinia striiformis f. sp. tritici]KAI9618812.1 hypothetical protein H4Q26_012066 [Puccinia striiformis f. sp. tritici PST-130]
MRLIRAHDGVAFEFTEQHLTATNNNGSLFEIIAETIQIEPNAIILMDQNGVQLNQNILLPATTTTDSLFYAFDRHFLLADPVEALNALATHPDHLLKPRPTALDPKRFQSEQEEEEEDPKELINLTLQYHQVGSIHLRTSLQLLSHVRAQKSAIEVALNNLDKCREPLLGTLEAYETFAKPLVLDYGRLLNGFGPSFALARKIKIHPALLPGNAFIKSNSNSQISATGGAHHTTTLTGLTKVEYMGDYVMEDRLIQIRDRCLKVYEEFKTRFESIRETLNEVNLESDQLRSELNHEGCDLSDFFQLERDAEDGFNRTEEYSHQIDSILNQSTDSEDSRKDLLVCFNELNLLDDDSRERIACLVERKNFWLHYVVNGLNKISKLQSIIPKIGVELNVLNNDLKTRTDSFRHLERLKDLVTAYASTVVEVVRRREYARHLADYASALNNLVSKLANDERRRRGVYHSEYSGKLPFTVEALEDKSLPTIEFEIRYIGNGGAILPKSHTGKNPNPINALDLPPLTRADVDELLAALHKIEDSPDNSTVDGYSPKLPAREVRLLVEKQFSRLEAMENAFALAVEKFVMSESESCLAGHNIDPEELTQLKARVAELEAAQDNLTERLRAESTAAITASRKAQQETQIHIRKTEDLKLQLLSVKEEARHEKERLTQDQQPLITELANATGTIERLNERIVQLEDELKSRNKSLQDTERQVTSARATADDATRELHDLEARHRDHVSDHEIVLNRLQQSRDRCTELERGLSESQNRNQTLSAQVEDQTQSMERRASEAEELKERMEKEIAELSARLEDEKQQNCNLQNKLTQQEIEIGHINQQSKLLVEAHTAAESRWKEETVSTTSCLENHCLKAVQALKTYQQVHRTIKDKITNMPRPGSSQKPTAASGSNTIPSQTVGEGADTPTGVVAKVDSGSNDTVIKGKEREEEKEELLPSPLSPEFEALLQSLLEFDHLSLVDTVQSKVDQLSISIRKWMKDCKGYRERASRSLEQAQVKITFRDFAKGDLALFLPTRNPSAQVWAAFNVSFPHYFLQANETVAPIIRSREWLVARIVSLTEKLVDPKEPETNPFQLPAGTRYFLLEVEPWSVEKNTRRMAHSMITTGDSPSRPKMQSQMRSATLPSQPGPQPPTASSSKRRSLVDDTPHASTSSSQPTISLARIEDTKPASSDLLDSVLSIQANPNQVDLTQSEYTVIDRASCPIIEASSDSPFRTSLSSSSSMLSRSGPSGLSLSLKTYHKSPLGPTPPTSSSQLQPLSEVDDPPEFKPSESARPAFLASLSQTGTSSSVSRKSGPSVFSPPIKPRSRPVPKAHNPSRSSSRAPSITSSSIATTTTTTTTNLNPAVKALLKSGSPSSKSTSTVSTTFTSMEKDPSSVHPPPSSTGTSAGLESGNSGAHTGIIKARTISTGSSSSPGTMSNVIELARRRLSFSSASFNNHTPLSPQLAGNGSQNSVGSSIGSGLFIGNNTLQNSPSNRQESMILVGGNPIPEPCQSPLYHPHLQHPNSTLSSSNIGAGTNTNPSGNSGLMTGSGFFGVWRRRKESNQSSSSSSHSSSTPHNNNNTSNNLPTISDNDVSSTIGTGGGIPIGNNNSSLHSPVHNSFGGASDMLKRFSSS